MNVNAKLDIQASSVGSRSSIYVHDLVKMAGNVDGVDVNVLCDIREDIAKIVRYISDCILDLFVSYFINQKSVI